MLFIALERARNRSAVNERLIGAAGGEMNGGSSMVASPPNPIKVTRQLRILNKTHTVTDARRTPFRAYSKTLARFHP